MVASALTQAVAQDRDRRFVAGIRSALIVGSMDLSVLDPAFADLGYDGLTGPHMSGFFLQYNVRPHLRLGVETLVANSDQNAGTSMNYQAAGPVAELSYGAKWFVAGGVHAGGLIVNAMARQGGSTDGASAGTFYKSNGSFVAPYADVGYRFGRGELGLFVKKVSVLGDRDGMSGFSSTFSGLRFAAGL